MDDEHSIFDVLPWMNVGWWPLWARRTFVCTLPVSAPLWVVVMALHCVLAIAALPFALVGLVIGAGIMGCIEIWQE